MPAIECRHCRKMLYYEQVADLPYFPFCSERCRLLDLGAWFSDKHRIPGEEAPSEEKE